MREVMYSEEFWQGSVGEVKALLRHVSLFKAQGVTSVDPASCLTQYVRSVWFLNHSDPFESDNVER
jgi:hypothetical protein